MIIVTALEKSIYCLTKGEWATVETVVMKVHQENIKNFISNI